MSVTTDDSTNDVAALFEPADAVQSYLGAFIDQRPFPKNLRSAIRYALLGGGKRLRPILVIRCCQALGGTAKAALAPAAAIEMIHAFSLVHDDLPAMDDDDLRRGRPTLHRHTSEAMAILAGDALSALAFEIIATRVEPNELAGIICHELAIATNDMIAGQVYDTLGEFVRSHDDLTRLQTVHKHKTGALIRCACRMGAMCGQADEGEFEALTRYGEAVGLMFQVVDDLLDVTQTTKQLGKASGKDQQQGKLTYPGVLGVDASRAEVTRLLDEAVAAVKGLAGRAEPLRALALFLAVRQK